MTQQLVDAIRMLERAGYIDHNGHASARRDASSFYINSGASVRGALTVDDIVTVGGYEYFPSPAVRSEWLQKSPKTPKDLECPHGVQFYDVVIDGKTHPRAAWLYEAPQPTILYDLQ